MSTKKQNIKNVIPDESIISKIYYLRSQKVMFDFDLAVLYGVDVKHLKRQVRRNKDRFPKDFMFQLSSHEFKNLKSQIGASSWGGRRVAPFAFTEQGVSMLSGVLNSKIAIQVHIQIIRVFAKMKEILLNYKDILLKLEKLEKDVKTNKEDISVVFDALKHLLNPPHQKRRLIGFNRQDEE